MTGRGGGLSVDGVRAPRQLTGRCGPRRDLGTPDRAGPEGHGWAGHDLGVALGVAFFQLMSTVLAVHHRSQPGRRPLDALGVALLLAGPLALVVRRRFPVAVLEIAFATTLAYVVIGYRLGPIWLRRNPTLSQGAAYPGHSRTYACCLKRASWKT